MATKYAVIDLETTGPSYSQGDRIIQIGIVFIEDQQVTHTLNMDIQPQMSVPANIIRLTGITDEQLEGAPTFEMIAGELWAALQDTIFVAHNVNFDYNFLNKSFQNAGFPAMTHPALDTVELIRVFFPTESSYKLADFAAVKGIELENAHTAFDDAQATAEILLLCQQKIKQLPKTLISQIKPFFRYFLADTGEIIQGWYDEADALNRNAHYHYQAPFTLIKNVKGGNVFPEQFGSQHAEYQERASNQAFISANNGVVLRPVQKDIIADILSFNNQKHIKHAFVTAGSGSGKTLSYLVGALGGSPQAKIKQRVLIATPTLVLQHQLLHQSLQLFADLFGRPISFAQLKSPSHYIDLSQFALLLNDFKKSAATVKKRDAMISMSLLVWLTETQSGDKSELNRGLLNETYWQKLESFPRMSIQNSLAQWGSHAFYPRQWEASRTAEVVITNYAYLFNHLNDLISESIIADDVMLVFDECHQLPEKLLQTTITEVRTEMMEKTLNAFSEIFHQLNEILMEKSQNDKVYEALFQTEMQLQKVWDLYDELLDQFSEHFQQESYYKQQTKSSAFFVDSQIFKQAPWRWHLMNFAQGIQQLVQEMKKFERATNANDTPNHLKPDWLQIRYELLTLNADLEKIVIADHRRYLQIETKLTSKAMHLALSSQYYHAGTLLKQLWLKLPTKNLMVSASNNVFSSEKQLAYNYGVESMQNFQYDNEFIIDKKIHSFILNDHLSLDKLNEREASKYVAQVILAMWQQPIHKIQVIFQSQSLLDMTFRMLERELDRPHAAKVFAQSQFSNILKMYDQFDRSSSAVLLGLASFSEGIHFGHDSDMLILTRLPFETPKSTRELAKQEWCQRNSLNYFEDVALPEMLIKLKQILGRILNHSGKESYIISLDQRIKRSSYTEAINKALPNIISFQEISLASLKETIYNSKHNPDFISKDGK